MAKPGLKADKFDFGKLVVEGPIQLRLEADSIAIISHPDYSQLEVDGTAPLEHAGCLIAMELKQTPVEWVAGYGYVAELLDWFTYSTSGPVKCFNNLDYAIKTCG